MASSIELQVELELKLALELKLVLELWLQLLEPVVAVTISIMAGMMGLQFQ